MSAGAAALLAMAATAYLMVGAAWALMVTVARTLNDKRVDAVGVLAQILLWPWAAWLFFRGAGE